MCCRVQCINVMDFTIKVLGFRSLEWKFGEARTSWMYWLHVVHKENMCRRVQTILSLTLVYATTLPVAVSWSAHEALEDLAQRIQKEIKGDGSMYGHRTMVEEERPENRRMQTPQDPACGDILLSVDIGSVQSFFDDAFNNLFSDPVTVAQLNFNVQQFSRYGFQLRKVCGSCTEFDVNDSEYQTNYCSPSAYGGNHTHSGLVGFPLSESGGTELQNGTFPGYMFCKGSDTSRAPSTMVRGTLSDLEFVLFSMLPVTFGYVSVAPDYMGFGEGESILYKSYLIQKGYQTAIIPIWFKTSQVLEQASNCKSALDDAAIIMGYSEGGYVATVIATTMFGLGIQILRLIPGGAPFATASTVIPDLIGSVDSGVYNPRFYFIIALLGSSYSSTYRDIANYNSGQDLLNITYRETIVDAVFRGEERFNVSRLLPQQDPLRIFDSDYIAWGRRLVQNPEPDPCNTTYIVGFNDRFCAAIRANDLVSTIETVAFPTIICHSVDDEIVGYATVPNVTLNDNLTLSATTGNHTDAAQFCLLQGLFVLISPDVLSYVPTPKHNNQACPTPTPTVPLPMVPSVSPSAAATPTSTTAPAMPTSTTAPATPTSTTAPAMPTSTTATAMPTSTATARNVMNSLWGPACLLFVWVWFYRQ